MNLYPLKFEPILKERLWGGTKLQSELAKNIVGDAIGESWELSGVKGDISKVKNGKLSGIALTELIETYQGKLLGESVINRFGEDFPILIKFIDAKKDLSIQLHPNDELAKERHNSFGKTEMWYIMQADEDANLIVGFNKDVTRKEYEKHLKENTLSELLNYESIEEGNTFFINTGKVHAIGAGTLLAEIQQTSDITYRIYDWNRKDKDGNTRELHTELALDAIDYKMKDDFKVKYPNHYNVRNEMVDCPYFKTNFIKVNQNLTFDLSDRDSFTIYMCVQGEGSIENEYGSEAIKRGETVLISADTAKVTIQSNEASFLEVSI